MSLGRVRKVSRSAPRPVLYVHEADGAMKIQKLYPYMKTFKGIPILDEHLRPRYHVTLALGKIALALMKMKQILSAVKLGLNKHRKFCRGR